MTALFFHLLQGATLALSAAIMPGPFQAFLLSRSLTHGWKRTLPAALAPLITDGPILTMVLLVLTRTPPWFLEALRIAGGLFILYLASGVYRSIRQAGTQPASAEGTSAKSLMSAVAINALNPNPYIFWGVVGGPIVLSAWRQSPSLGVAFLSGFFGTFVCSLALLIILFATAGRLDPRVHRFLYVLSFAALLAFGFYQTGTGIAFWL
ncbi:MAG: LysE family transporter [Deltaproteobacteria bacterium]|nr:LysE family transporter [Deltaproteobacteria bacterium]